MARDPDGGPDDRADVRADGGPNEDGDPADADEASTDQSTQATDGNQGEPVETRAENTDRSDGEPLSEATDSNTHAISSSRHTTPQPTVSVTIEGEYESVFERIEHPQVSQHHELDAIVANIEETLQAVLRTGGGIRSEIYDATDFELEDPWEIRKYLEVLAMHDLIRLQNDRWVPSDYFEGATRDDGE
jgi:hypothetical protein